MRSGLIIGTLYLVDTGFQHLYTWTLVFFYQNHRMILVKKHKSPCVQKSYQEKKKKKKCMESNYGAMR